MNFLDNTKTGRKHFLAYLDSNVQLQPDKVAIRVSSGGLNPDEFNEHTYSNLHAAVLDLSQKIRGLVEPGERALILMPSGIDFITAFLACLHSGVIAVPAYPPRRNRNRERILSIHDDAQPALILTTEAFEPHVRESLPTTQAHVLIFESTSIDTPPPPGCGEDGSQVFNPLHNPDGIAFLQYTSGSTGAPKGTVITHANLVANLEAIQALFRHEPQHEVLSWLPPYHDMGLIGCVLTPIFGGMTVTYLTPEEFMRKPIRWLQTIASRKSPVSSGAPNFAWQLLADRATEEEIDALDLSNWRIAFNGAEPVQAATLERFTKRFAQCGFRAEAWLPCYGLAETTLLAAGRRGTAGILSANRMALEQSRFGSVADNDPNATHLVSCGQPALNTAVTILDPETNNALPEDCIGEVYISSPSVAAGYWRNEAATAAAFPQPGTLRTGDLGFLHDGELYVTGRVKDLIIIRGRNLFPHDIESCVAAQLPAASGANNIAAFEFSGSSGNSLGLLIEAPRAWVSSLRKDDEEIVSHVHRIREAVAETFEITADLIAFVAPGNFPRTSSGKVQRSACRDGVLNGTLQVIYRNQLSTMTSLAPSSESNHDRQSQPFHDTSPQDLVASKSTADSLIKWLRDFARRRINSQLMDERRTIAPHVILEFGNHGLFGLEVPSALGGLALTPSDGYRVMEQLAAIDLTLALLVGIHNALGLRPVLRYGPSSLCGALIPTMASGRHLTSFAITELSTGSHPKTIETTAVRGSDGCWTIHGRKQWIGTASWAGTITVIAKARDASGEHLGSIALAVPEDAEGLSFGREAVTMGMRGSVQVPVFFNGVKVDASRVLGEIGRGFEVAYDAMRLARVGLAALSLGAMKRCLQWMAQYAEGREVAGGRLAELPATQARLGETVNAIAAVEALVQAVGSWLDAGLELPEEVFLICKTTAPELLGETADRAMQMLGARGYMENNGIPQLFRDARLLRIFEGPTEALNANLGIRIRRGSDALSGWMEKMQGSESIASLRTLAAEHTNANDVDLGELASLQFLLWIVRQVANPGSEQTSAWLENRFLQRSNSAKVAASATLAVSEIASRLKDQIGVYDPMLPGEDREVDLLLRHEQHDLGGSSALAQISPIESFHRVPVAFDGSLLEQLEHGLLDFLRREKLGQMESVPLDATFTSLGIDSLGAASLAIEIEKEFGVKITDETLYDYPTLQRLAGYIDSRRTPDGTPAEQGKKVWQRDIDEMNARVGRLEKEGRYFYEKPFEAQDSTSVWFGGKRCVHLSSYSYLGFVADEDVKKLVDEYSSRLGCGSHGTRMLATTQWHLELETLIAKTLQSETAVTFGTGFVTNWAVISTLMSDEDTIIADEWIHASLVDGDLFQRELAHFERFLSDTFAGR